MGFITKYGGRIARRAAVALIALALLAPLMLPAPAVRAAAIQYVGTTADDTGSVTDCTNALFACTLRDALNAASLAPGSTVSLPPGNVNLFAITLAYGQLTISQSVTIQGGGLLIVDGGGASRVFNVTGGTVAMDGVTIRHGLASTTGAGINETGGSLTLNNCLVTDNTLSGTGRLAGGGIYEAGDLALTNTTVSGNTVTDTGTTTADSAVGGGIEQDGGTLTVTGSTISGNTAQMTAPNVNTQMGGGGIFSTTTMHMTGSTVSGNRAIGAITLDAGGGVFVFGSATLTNSTIAANSAGNEGGGITAQGALTLTNSTVTGNAAPATGGLLNFGSATLTGALVARNSDGNGTPDTYGAITGGSSNNLIGNGTGVTGISNGSQGNQVGTGAAPIDPHLDPNGLHTNGSAGPQTIALLPNSPAIEAGGTCPNGVTTDERGQPRIGSCDIGAYEYQPVTPTVADAAAPASGGAVTFHGTGFQTGTQLTIAGITTGATAGAVSGDGTTFTLPVPAHSAGNVGFAVTNPGSGHIALGTLTYQPVVTSLSPNSGATAGGGAVTITGVGFVAGATSAMVGTTPAAVTGVTATTVTVTVPAHAAGAVDVTVTVNGATGTMPGGYIYGAVAALPPPAPTAGPVGGGAPLPAPRPAGPPVGGSPSPLPPTRP